jgi:hypothetical protein
MSQWSEPFRVEEAGRWGCSHRLQRALPAIVDSKDLAWSQAENAAGQEAGEPRRWRVVFSCGKKS